MSNAALRALYMVLDPVDPSQVPNGTLFLDSSNSNVLSQKSSTGVVSVIGAGGGGSNPFLRQMVAGEAFTANKPLAIRPDGKVVLADSDGTNRKIFIGHSMQTSLGDGSVINVLCVTATLGGAISGLGFTSGQSIFMGETAGTYTNNVSTFSGSNDTYVKVGIALPPPGVAQAAATDLLIFTELIASD
jgi:hypothetical protein